MANLKYVMNETEQKLYDVIQQDGIKGALSVLVRALTEHGHNLSDMGIKYKASQAIDVAGIIQDVRDTLEE
jgi:hypothetical protein